MDIYSFDSDPPYFIWKPKKRIISNKSMDIYSFDSDPPYFIWKSWRYCRLEGRAYQLLGYPGFWRKAPFSLLWHLVLHIVITFRPRCNCSLISRPTATTFCFQMRRQSRGAMSPRSSERHICENSSSNTSPNRGWSSCGRSGRDTKRRSRSGVWSIQSISLRRNCPRSTENISEKKMLSHREFV